MQKEGSRAQWQGLKKVEEKAEEETGKHLLLSYSLHFPGRTIRSKGSGDSGGGLLAASWRHSNFVCQKKNH